MFPSLSYAIFYKTPPFLGTKNFDIFYKTPPFLGTKNFELFYYVSFSLSFYV